MRGVLLLVATVVAGLFGLFSAAGAHGSSGYTIGLGIAVASSLFGFLVIRSIVDGAAAPSFLPDKPGSGWTTVAILVVLVVVGLFLAAGSHGHYYDAGLGLSGACLLLIALTMKRIFDRQESNVQHSAGPT